MGARPSRPRDLGPRLESGTDPGPGSWKAVATELGFDLNGHYPLPPDHLLKAKASSSSSSNDGHRHLRCVCISDTHGAHDGLVLPPGDVLIHSGDFMNAGEDMEAELDPFIAWLSRQPFRHKIVVAGNHDRMMDAKYFAGKIGSAKQLGAAKAKLRRVATYLEDGGVTIEGVTFYGSPWTPAALGWGFYRERGEPLRRVWREMARSHAQEAPIDVLVTHGPPLGVLDAKGPHRHIGDEHLLRELAAMDRPPVFHVYGHIHGCYGSCRLGKTTRRKEKSSQPVEAAKGTSAETKDGPAETKQGDAGTAAADDDDDGHKDLFATTFINAASCDTHVNLAPEAQPPIVFDIACCSQRST